MTDEHVHDSKVLPDLVDDVIKSDSMRASATIGKLIADISYDSNNIFRYPGDNGILSYTKQERILKFCLKLVTFLETF